jgi:hypothetical protein
VTRSRDVGVNVAVASVSAVAGVATMVAGGALRSVLDPLAAGPARARHAGDDYFGSVETSLSHLVRSRVRSADEPYFAKS